MTEFSHNHLINVWISPSGEVHPVAITGHSFRAFELLHGDWRDPSGPTGGSPPGFSGYEQAQKELITRGYYKINHWPGGKPLLYPETPLEKIPSSVRRSIINLLIEYNLPVSLILY